MRKKLLLVALAIIPLFGLMSHNKQFNETAEAEEINCYQVNNNSFKPGEKVTYKVYYNWKALWVGAGEVSFNVKPAKYKDRDLYHITALGSTYSSYDWIYKVRDRFETVVDPVSLMPISFLRDINEGGFTIYNNLKFDRENSRVITTHEDFKTAKRTDTMKINACTQDILSAIYFMRNIDFSKYKPNDLIPMSVFLDNELYDIQIRYLGKERIKTKHGKFNTIKFSPMLIEGNVFTGEEKMYVWVTDDSNKIPVLIESPLSVGSIKAVIQDYEGVRHPFTSKVH